MDEKASRTLILDKKVLEALIYVHLLALPPIFSFDREIEEISIREDKVIIVYKDVGEVK